jgi:hypothetical protein
MRRSPRRDRPRTRRRGGARAGCGRWSRGLFYSGTSALTRRSAGRLRRKRVVFAHEQRGAPPLPAPRRLGIRAAEPVDFAGNGPFPATCSASAAGPESDDLRRFNDRSPATG